MHNTQRKSKFESSQATKSIAPGLTLKVVEPALEIMERIDPLSLGEDLQLLVLVFQTSTFMCSLRHVGDRPESHPEKRNLL